MYNPGTTPAVSMSSRWASHLCFFTPSLLSCRSLRYPRSWCFRFDPKSPCQLSSPRFILHPFQKQPRKDMETGDNSRRVWCISRPTHRRIGSMFRKLPRALSCTYERIFWRRLVDQVGHPSVPAWFYLITRYSESNRLAIYSTQSFNSSRRQVGRRRRGVAQLTD